MEEYKAVLCHHGILGQRWGVRRFQNSDGSLTTAGAKRYQTAKDKKLNRHDKAAAASRRDAENLRKHGYKEEADAVEKVARKQQEKADAKRAKQKYKDDEFMKGYNTGEKGEAVAAVMGAAVGAGISGLKSYQTGRSKTSAILHAIGGAALGSIAGSTIKYGRDEFKKSEEYLAGKEAKRQQKNANHNIAYKENPKNAAKIAKREAEIKAQTEKFERDKAKYNQAAYEHGYSKGFIDYVTKQTGGFHQIDDPELIELMEMDYKEETGRSSRRK